MIAHSHQCVLDRLVLIACSHVNSFMCKLKLRKSAHCALLLYHPPPFTITVQPYTTKPLASVNMRYRQELSVVFEDAKEKECKECKEWPVPNGDNGGKTAVHTLVCMEAGERIAVRLMIEPDFDFCGADGIRVTIAVGHRPASPDNGQSFWVPQARQDKTITWTHLLTWASESAKKTSQRRLKAPAPAGKFMLLSVSISR